MKQLTILAFIALNCQFLLAQRLVGNYYDYGKIHPHEQYYVNAAGQKNGSYKEYSQNGVVVAEYNYLNGLRNGSCIDYAATENNQRVVKVKATYSNDQRTGYYVEFCDQDGYKSKAQEGHYKNGQKTGLWKEWWCTEIYDKTYFNVLESVGVYKENEKDSVWSLYNKTGQIEKVVRYKNGVPDGEWTEYAYLDNGKLFSVGNFSGDITGYNPYGSGGKKATGAWTYYYPDGSIYARGVYKNSIKDGVWTFYWQGDSSKIASSNEYREGTSIGAWKLFFEDNFKNTESPERAAYYRLVTFDNAGNPAPDNVQDFKISGEKIWEGPLNGADAFVFKKH